MCIRDRLEAVPAFKAKDVGFDRSLVGAYGQDDRVCAYTELMAVLELNNPEKTAVAILTDKAVSYTHLDYDGKQW